MYDPVMPIWETWSAKEWALNPHQRVFAARNGRLNAVLYRMCEEMRGHRDRGMIRAKVAVVGRTYASGLERHIKGGLDRVATTLLTARPWLDKEISSLRRMRDHEPTIERIAAIATTHARLQRALQAVTRNRNNVRSFVSKYLHFHAPVVPIFDQYANLELTCWYRWPPRPELVKMPRGVDGTYWRHCVRTAFVVDDWRRLNIGPPTARAIDDYAITSWETTT